MVPDTEGNLELITTRDGSHSLVHKQLNETYHSRHGAYQESVHVFIKMGWDYWINKKPDVEKPIHLLEVGMGTGLNVWLTLNAFLDQKKEYALNYYALEPYPVDANILNRLNYIKISDKPDRSAYFSKIHQAPWNKKSIIASRFNLLKINDTLQNFLKSTETTFDIIYFDAFAPNKQEEMWSLELLKKTTSILNPDGILVTYCAKGQLKRDIKQLGLKVETLQGPPGKAEMVRATK